MADQSKGGTKGKKGKRSGRYANYYKERVLVTLCNKARRQHTRQRRKQRWIAIGVKKNGKSVRHRGKEKKAE